MELSQIYSKQSASTDWTILDRSDKVVTVPMVVGTGGREIFKDNQRRIMQTNRNCIQSWRLIILLLWALPAAVQAQFTYTTNTDGSLTITGYTGSDANIVVPSSILGNTVTAIGAYAFVGTNGIIGPGASNIAVPSTVTNLADLAFTSVNTYSSDLMGVYFQGNAPAGSNSFAYYSGSFSYPIIYYSQGTTGWGTNFNGRPTQAWFPGELQMTLSPTGAITDGAQWQVDGGTWQTNGGVIGNLSAGNHTVSFKTIKGWRAPDNEIISVGTNFITPVAAASYSALPGGPSKPIFQVMHSFPGGQQPTQLSAFGPTSPLIYISNMLYGTTYADNGSNQGTIFAIHTDGTGFTNIYTFTDGGSPSSIIQSGTVLYGNTSSSIFKVNMDGTGYATLCSNLDGVNNGIVLWSNTLYGTTRNGGGGGNNGILFSVNTDGTGFIIQHYFGSSVSDGALPLAGLVLSGNTLYGDSHEGIKSWGGTPFAMQTDGTGFTNYPIRGNFYATMGLSSNQLYLMTDFGIFKMGTDGSGFTNFCDIVNIGGIIIAGNTIYGTTFQGNAGPFVSGQYGSIFAIRTDGSGFTNLYNFTGGSDGAYPQASLLLLGTTLFGTAYEGGINNGGTVFMLSYPPPQLNIKSSGTNAILSWPSGVAGAGYDNFFVQSTTNLTPPVTWTAVSTPAALVNGLNTVTNPISGAPTFYRLSQ